MTFGSALEKHYVFPNVKETGKGLQEHYPECYMMFISDFTDSTAPPTKLGNE